MTLTALRCCNEPCCAVLCCGCVCACLFAAQAKDGVCDDGRLVFNMTRGLGSRVLCDLGTDCTDCGVWKGQKNSSNW